MYRIKKVLFALAKKSSAFEWILLRYYYKVGGEMQSMGLREYFEFKYRIYCGLYSYGCFTPVFNSGGHDVHIGRYCSIAANVRFLGANHPIERFSMSPLFYNKAVTDLEVQDVQRGSLDIGNDVWIGYNTIITKGCTKIGNGAVVGAGTIVTKDVPEYAIVCGNPGKVVRYRFSKEEISALSNSQWWKLTPEQLGEICKSSYTINDFADLCCCLTRKRGENDCYKR